MLLAEVRKGKKFFARMQKNTAAQQIDRGLFHEKTAALIRFHV
jgi:hypothetical protein